MLVKIEVDLYKANKLLEINKMLTQSLHLNEILHNVVQAACELVEVADVIIIYLYDEGTKTLRFAKGKGVNEVSLAQVSFVKGESITGKVFVNRQSKLFKTQVEIEEYMKNMTEDNNRYYYEGVQQRDVKSSFCVPIMNKGRCLGVVVVNNFKHDSIFTAEDMNVIEVLAGQSAIAIDNAKMYEHLQQKNLMLEMSISSHSKFYRLLIEGRGIDTVLSLLKRMIGSAVSYHSNLEVKGDVNAFPIRKGTDTLGYLSLIQPFEDFTEMERIKIEQASMSIALELIKENALYEKEIHFREQVFNQLMEGISGKEMEYALNYVKWGSDTRVQCLIMEGNKKPLWEIDKLIGKEQLVKSVERMLQSERIDPLIFTRAFQLIMILPTGPEQSMRKMLESIRRVWPGDQDIVYGIGRETTLKELAVSYKEATRSIGYAKRYDIPVVEYSMLGIERLLYELDQDLLERFMDDKLHRLLTVDSSLVNTLKLYIQLNKNHKQTAKELHIHPNTLYYRLKKVEELLEIDFTNEKDWIDLVVAFKIYGERN
ncbi:helix-turn-helix domain-containing protein [Sporosarcina sp. FA9]|uniref:helix-turn-helix domain-containing protein n=1 Tax=Sporosarcina sp. FA9 TaxID=3413030 RepID=UPI003F657E53